MRIRRASESDVFTIAAIVAECDDVATPSDYELRKAREGRQPAGTSTHAELGTELSDCRRALGSRRR